MDNKRCDVTLSEVSEAKGLSTEKRSRLLRPFDFAQGDNPCLSLRKRIISGPFADLEILEGLKINKRQM